MTNPLKVCDPTPEDLAWLGSDPVSSRPYYDPAYLELEREAIFKRTWIQVAHVSELPAKNSFIVKPIEIANTSILIVKDKHGELRAFHNICTHRGTKLIEKSSGIKAVFSCPYHKWTFSNEGGLLSAPDFDKFSLNKSDCSLPAVSVDSCGGFIFVNLTIEPSETLAEFLGPYAQTLESLPSAQADTFSEYVYDINANWKVTYDNFQENYHLRFVHPKTGAAVVTKDNPYAYPNQYCFYGSHRSQIVKKVPSTKAPEFVQKLAFGKAIGKEAGSPEKIDCKLFPNLLVVGLSAYTFSHCIMPISHNKSRGVVRVYWVGDDGSASQRFSREYMAASLRDVHVEDISIIERGQRGLDSGCLDYINFQIHEALCRHFSNAVARQIENHKNGDRENDRHELI